MLLQSLLLLLQHLVLQRWVLLLLQHLVRQGWAHQGLDIHSCCQQQQQQQLVLQLRRAVDLPLHIWTSQGTVCCPARKLQLLLLLLQP